MDHSWGYGTDQRLREENQDCHGVFDLPDFTLAVVCDGMGGHVGGAQASALAVKTIHDTLVELQGRPIPQALEQAIERTNLVIYEAARKNHRLMGMGTTAVVAAITDDACYLAHVGDSRAYLLRQGQVQQLTRDHTMVNLFVDAELLSPEDAATHPEAHVLSRSLGVERQVDVELASPIRLEPGDVVFLCSDGVHGVVTDWELANIEWGAPHAGVTHVLSIVATREGDDNATAVSVLMGTSFEDVPPTAVPEPRRFDEVAPAQGGVTAVPAEDVLGSEHPHTMGGDSQAPTGYLLYDDQPAPGAHNVRPPPDMVAPPEQFTPPPIPYESAPGAPPRTPPPRPPPRRRNRLAAMLPIVAASLMLVVALAGVVILLFGSDAPPPPPPDVPDVPTAGGEPPGLPQAGTPPPVPESGEAARSPTAPSPGDPSASPGVAQAAAAVEPAAPVFAPGDMPKPPRRIPHRPQKFTQPPPGGADQYRAVDAARRQDCPEALNAVQDGMAVSIDHATLFRGAWLCFNEAHQRPLEQVREDSWEDFQLQLHHFEGTPEQKARHLEEDPKLKRMPAWYRPPVGGLEYRIERLSTDEGMDQVITDLFGEPKLTDQIAKDLWMEAVAAEWLSTIPPAERQPAMEDAWARRVYFLAWALQTRSGRLLDDHWSDLLPELRRKLDAATTERKGPDGRTWRVPASVLRARRVAEGNEPPPTPTPIRRKGPSKLQKIIDDYFGTGADGDPEIRIDRAGSN